MSGFLKNCNCPHCGAEIKFNLTETTSRKCPNCGCEIPDAVFNDPDTVSVETVGGRKRERADDFLSKLEFAEAEIEVGNFSDQTHKILWNLYTQEAKNSKLSLLLLLWNHKAASVGELKNQLKQNIFVPLKNDQILCDRAMVDEGLRNELGDLKRLISNYIERQAQQKMAIRAAQERQEFEEREKFRQDEKRKNRLIFFAVIAMVVAASVFWGMDYMKSKKYSEAMALADLGNFDKSLELLISLGNYKDCPDQIFAVQYRQAADAEKRFDHEKAFRVFSGLKEYRDAPLRALQNRKNQALASNDAVKATILRELGDFSDCRQILSGLFKENPDIIEAGDLLEFGRNSSGKALCWIVLDRSKDKLLLLSQECVSKQVYDTRLNLSWRNSSVRYWLHRNFLFENFTIAERAAIDITELSTGKDDSEELCDNRFFLLSPAEFDKYLAGKTTAVNSSGPWFLRDSGAGVNVPTIEKDGQKSSTGYPINSPCGLRPAFWLRVK